MRTFLASATALLIAASLPALADNKPHGAGGGAPPPKAQPAAAKPAKPTGPAQAARPPAKRQPAHRAKGSKYRHHHARPSKRRRVTVRRPPPVTVRVDVSKLHRMFHANQRFHAGLYNRPFGWYAYDWRIGQRLPRGWFVREYWIGDWAPYGLFAPPAGMFWVRVGPDAILVNGESGEIITVYNDLFW